MVEFVIGAGAAGFVPFAFVDADHFAGVAGDAAVGEELGRLGEDEAGLDGVETTGTVEMRNAQKERRGTI